MLKECEALILASYEEEEAEPEGELCDARSACGDTLSSPVGMGMAEE